MLETLMLVGCGLVPLLFVLGVALTFSKQISGLISAAENVTITDDGGVVANTSVPKAQPATLTTHTTNTSGTITMTNSSHGITTGQRVDIFWTGGQCYGATVGTVSGTTVPITTVSGGSNLPSSSTPITVGIPTSCAFGVTGNNVQALAATIPIGQNGYVVFNNGSSDVLAYFITGGYVTGWKTGDSGTNPLAGATPTVVYLSHNNTNNAVTGIQAAAVVH